MDTSFHASENEFISEDCGKCLKSRSGLRRHRLRQHLKQDMKFKCTTNYWLIRPAMVNKNLSHVITVTTNCQGISQSSWGRDSSTCSERIISSGLLTFFSGSNDYNCNCLQIDSKDIKSWFHKIYLNNNEYFF
jgi:hypothetical protein